MNISFFDDKPFLEDLHFKMDKLLAFKSVSIDELNNLLFYGVPGSGKTTKIYALLASIFNNKKVYDLKNIVFEEDKKTIVYKASIYHIEIDAVNLASNEKLFIQSFLRGYVENRNIGLDIPKIVFIKNADKMSIQSQLSMRKIIERNTYTVKFIFEISQYDKFSEPLKSRCLCIRVPMPKIEDIKLCLQKYSELKKYEITDDEINTIIQNNNIITYKYNLKKIFGHYRYFIITRKHFHFLYYDYFNEIIELINKKASFTSMSKIRELINDMYINLVSMEDLIEYVFYTTYNKNINNKNINNKDFIIKLINLYSETDHRLNKGNKECLHAEYFIISVISLLYK